MKTYVDISGASGGTYRFQNVAVLSKMPASAGNFVLVSDLVNSDAVTCCGSALSLARAPLDAIAKDHGNLPVFVRLNISRSVRVSELEDIVARHRPKRVLAELDQSKAWAYSRGPGRFSGSVERLAYALPSPSHAISHATGARTPSFRVVLVLKG